MYLTTCCGSFYSPKKQEECKSQEEGDEREGVAHGVHQLQGGQQGIMIHLDTGRADMTTRTQSTTPSLPSPMPRATQAVMGVRNKLKYALGPKSDYRTFLPNFVDTKTSSPNCLWHTSEAPKPPSVGAHLSLTPWLDLQPTLIHQKSLYQKELNPRQRMPWSIGVKTLFVC